MKSPRDRRWKPATGSTAAATLLIVMTAVAGQQDKDASDIDQITKRKQPSAPVSATIPVSATATGGDRIDSIQLERLKRARMQVKKADIFRSKSWYVPPPPPPPAPPPPPTAPPLPFTFLGKFQESDGKLTIFLAGENRVYLVGEGETIDNNYHVDGIADGKLELTYLPLKIKQYINLGETP